MNKYIWIGGGVVVVGGIAFIIAKNRAASNAASEEPQQSPMLDTAYMGGMAPTSGGFSSPISYTGNDAGAISTTPVTTGNSGTTGTGGGFDIGSLFGQMFSSTAAANQASIRTQGQNYESTVLSSIIGQNGSATVSHSQEGTTIVNTQSDPQEAIINSIFQKELGRNAASGGMTFYKNELQNMNRSIGFITDQIHNSPEAKQRRGEVSTAA